jgi:hypothetical protein
MGWDRVRDDGRFHPGCERADYFPNHSHTLTGSTGHFYLTFWTCETVDTLAVAVVTPDTVIMGSIVPMDSMRDGYVVIEEEYEREEDGGGCDDGTTARERRIAGYIFSADSLRVHVPW